MYINPAFRQDDPAARLALIRQHPFATLVVTTETGPEASHLPLIPAEDTDETLVLEGHFARANGMAGETMNGARALAIFQGPQHYISSRWYPSTRRTGLGVPTWNYQVVHCHGRLALIDPAASTADHDWLEGHLRRLTQSTEATLNDPDTPPWRMADAPPEHIEKLMGGVVGFRLVVDRIEASFKLSQNKSDEDRNAVMGALEHDGTDEALAMADAMRRFAPEAD